MVKKIEMQVTIHGDRPAGKLRNFWNNIHFHPTDAIEDAWGQRILDRVAEDHAAQTVRMYAMLEDIVSIGPDGSLQYDFTENDVRMDYMVSKGFNLLMSYNFLPPCIAEEPELISANNKNATRYKGKMIVASKPRDYRLWEEVCRTYTAHIVERYGLERVSGWYLQCFNEPDMPGYWMKNEPGMAVRCAEYCKLYDAFGRGVCAVSDRLRLGGPAWAYRVDFLEPFLKHILTDGIRMDFLCFHAYGTNPYDLGNGVKPLNAANSLERIMTVMALAKKYGLDQIPMVIDEWGASSCGFFNMEECPELIFRENEIFAAYFVKMLTLYHRIGLPIEKLMICLSGQHEMKTDFSGFRGFFTLHGYPKPIYNAYVLAAKLGENKLDCETPETEGLSVLPSISDDGRIAVLLSWSAQNFTEDIPWADLELRISGISDAQREARLWRIDREHANAYREYQRLRSPDTPTAEQMKQITEAGTLHSENLSFHDTIKLTMRPNSVVLIEC